MQKKLSDISKKYFSFSWHDTLLSILLFLIAVSMCIFLRVFDKSDVYVSMIFILSVFLISRFTDGYFYGTFFSLLSVLAVNYIFTYPVLEFNFTLSGYPLTIMCMLVVSITTSTMITQIKRHSELRLEAEKEKTRSNLLRAISHDLRTPLTSIIGSTSAIIDNDKLIEDKQRLKLLNEIKDDSEWLIRMVENLLTITRIDDDREAKITKKPEAAEEVASEAVMKFQKRFPEENIIVSVPEDLLIVPMDAILIEQVIINLLENAVIHAKSQTEIVLEIKNEGNNADFKVKDNGKGIDEKIISKIFNGQMKISDDKASDKKRNMGIGLSVCYTIIKAHNGNMTAYNQISGGAVFRFSLPLEEE